MEVRHTTASDLDAVMAIYDHARQTMRESGNTTQWVNGYPSRSVIEADMERMCSYVVEKEGRIAGVFTFIIGEDPTYSVIDGEWPDNLPYGTIHRIASAPGESGIADACLAFCLKSAARLRIDTHLDNHPMLNWIRSRGFVYCGIIRIADGSPRLAFQLTAEWVTAWRVP